MHLGYPRCVGSLSRSFLCLARSRRREDCANKRRTECKREPNAGPSYAHAADERSEGAILFPFAASAASARRTAHNRGGANSTRAKGQGLRVGCARTCGDGHRHRLRNGATRAAQACAGLAEREPRAEKVGEEIDRIVRGGRPTEPLHVRGLSVEGLSRGEVTPLSRTINYIVARRGRAKPRKAKTRNRKRARSTTTPWPRSTAPDLL